MQLQHDSIHEGGFITNGNPELQSHPSFTDRTGSLSSESYPSFIRRLSLSMKIRTILGAFVWASLPAMAENMTRSRSSSSRRSGCMNMSTVKECPNEEKAWRRTNEFDRQRFVPFICADITEHVQVGSEIKIEHGIRQTSDNEISPGISPYRHSVDEPGSRVEQG